MIILKHSLTCTKKKSTTLDANFKSRRRDSCEKVNFYVRKKINEWKVSGDIDDKVEIANRKLFECRFKLGFKSAV